MVIFDAQEKIFNFTTDPRFQELGDEIIECAKTSAQNLTFPLPELQARFTSRERIFYPYTLTQVIHWKMGDRIHSCLILAFSDRRFIHVDFFQRNRETFHTLATLFHKFYGVDFQILGKLDFIVGQSPSIRKLKETIAKVAKVDFSLSITGESGSGKELVAKAVQRSRPPGGKSLRIRQLGRDSRASSGGGIVWLPARVPSRANRSPCGLDRIRRPGNTVPGRDRRPAAKSPSETPPRPPGKRNPTPG